ncbi:MAG: TfoX/Sxy family protein [Saprospiraceae bacterium]|jgi:hypothetical protein
MAYSEHSAQRIREVFLAKKVDFFEKKMFSGICFMVDDKMCCGTHIDKNTNEDLLLCRVGDDKYESCLEKDGCIPMEFTGKPMKGFVFVLSNGVETQKQLEYWIQLCLEYNPKAKKSKNR